MTLTDAIARDPELTDDELVALDARAAHDWHAGLTFSTIDPRDLFRLVAAVRAAREPKPAAGTSSLGRVTFAPHVGSGITGSRTWAKSYPDRRCPECGTVEINGSETVCLVCSNRAWSDR